MMGAIIIFKENIFIFSFVVTKLLGVGAHVRRWQREQNVER
jgi:uncharacterized protein HemY